MRNIFHGQITWGLQDLANLHLPMLQNYQQEGSVYMTYSAYTYVRPQETYSLC